ncbi:MAG: rhodanese-like domain-containing protein [Algisphaera sp.]
MNHINRIALMVLVLALTACDAQNTPRTSIVEKISANAASKWVTQKETVVVLDVRTPEEYAAGHIQDALHINISDSDFASKVAKLDREKTYIVHCAGNFKNGRASDALKIMEDLGFTQLRDLAGGFAAWRAAGHAAVE